MKQWFIKFWEDNGQKLFYLALATAFGLGFIKYLDMAAEGRTLLVAVCGVLLTKIRGTAPNGKEKTNGQL